MFFETIDGDLVPVSRIRRIRAASGRDSKWLVQLSDGEEVVIGISAKAALDSFPMASFAAAPGTEVLRVGDGEIFRYAVIGWVVSACGNPVPVTVDGLNDGSECDEYLHVLLPDGKVYRAEEATHTFEEFKRLHNAADVVIRIDAETPGFAEFMSAASK